MNFDLSDDQKLLREQARRMLAERSSYARLRVVESRRAGWDESLWREMADLGWPAAAIPERHGGLGLGDIELCVLAEELGRHVAPVPFISSIGLAAGAIALLGTEEQKLRYLPKLASGEIVGTFAFAEGPGATPEVCQTRYSGCKLSGRKWPVPDAEMAQIAVITARTDDDAVAVVVAELEQPGVEYSALVGLDELRMHGCLQFKRAAAELLTGAAPGATIAQLFDRAATLMAFEQVGGAQACLDMAKEYVMQRHTFGRSVGSYQAVKHRLADMLVAIELARSNVLYAAWALASAPGLLPIAAATARLSATEAYDLAAEENLQLHGGIGYTVDANCYFHYRRARLLAVAAGSSAYWSDRLVERLSDVDSRAAHMQPSRA